MGDKKEYIEREALRRDLIDNRSFYPAIVKCAIESAPAADVVEVVRCKDCVHGLKSNQCNPDSRLCDINYYADGGRKIMNCEDFCVAAVARRRG